MAEGDRERLDAWLAHRGLGSRSQVRALIRSGRVRVGNRVERDAAAIVAATAAVAVDGQVIAGEPPPGTLLLHKPTGCACSHDPREAPLVYDLLPPAWARLGFESAGRLDRDTSGLLVLSRDGALIHALTAPRRRHGKRYRIAYAGTLAADAIAQVAAGLRLDGEAQPTLPAELDVAAPGRATLILHEGRFHQVRRMIAALGGTVTALHRDRIGALDLPGDLGPGQVRAARADELARLTAPAP